MRIALSLCIGLCWSLAAQEPQEVRLRLSDEITIVGDVYRSSARPGSPAILLFHQGGGSARGEYADIVPRLLAENFHVMAADVRGGGTRFGGTNRASAAGPGFRYCTAIADIEGAVTMARANGLTGPLIVWGSSYTATLAIQLAGRRPADVLAVLAFSPARGEPMSECEPVAHAPTALRSGIPMLLMNTSVELENPETRLQFDRLSGLGARTFVANGRGHGSSILVASRFEGDVTPQWSAVLEFLQARK